MTKICATQASRSNRTNRFSFGRARENEMRTAYRVRVNVVRNVEIAVHDADVEIAVRDARCRNVACVGKEDRAS